jgi:hypothetical protein
MADEFSINIFIMSSFYKLLKLNPYVSPEIAKESNNFSKNSQHQKGLNSLHIEADLVYDRAEWRNRIHLADHS